MQVRATALLWTMLLWSLNELLAATPSTLVLFCLLLGAAIYVATLLLGTDARVAAPIIARFFLTIGLPVLLILGGAIWLAMPLLNGLDPRIVQALIAGLVIIVGWLTTAIFSQEAKARSRAEKLRDYHKAIYAEIGNTLVSFGPAGAPPDHAEALIKRMKGDETYAPFVPREVHDHVYDAVIAEIDVLPRQTIDAIVAYYSLIKSLGALVDDMRGATFATLEADRKIAMYGDYIEMRKQAYLFGEYALRLITAYSTGGAKAADAMISSLAEGRYDRSQGSV